MLSNCVNLESKEPFSYFKIWQILRACLSVSYKTGVQSLYTFLRGAYNKRLVDMTRSVS